MAAHQYLVQVQIFEEGGFWVAKSAEMQMHFRSNDRDKLYLWVLKEFDRQYVGKTGDFEISMKFVSLESALKEEEATELT